MQQYKDLISDILENGTDSGDRTGTGTKSLFGRQIRFDLQKGFPLVTLKKTFWKGVVLELLWMIRGDTNIKWLNENGVHIWDEWANNQGDLGPVYGAQWRKWQGKVKSADVDPQYVSDDKMCGEITFQRQDIDQLRDVVRRIKANPNCRRLIVTAWNPGEIDEMALPPCHCFFQFYVRDGKLSCQLYQRSADAFLGVPFNIASYALLTHLVAYECELKVGEFVHTFGDVHLYNNHLEQAREMISRDCKELPQLELDLGDVDVLNWASLKAFFLSWGSIKKRIKLTGYKPHPAIKAEVSV